MKIEPHLASHSSNVLTLTELRVLSGLSRGAAMPFEGSVTIGSDFACDLILVDPGVGAMHAVLSETAEGYTLRELPSDPSAVHGGTVVELHHGTAFEVAGVRMLICESDAAWDFSLPVPVPPPLTAIEAAVADGVAAGRLGARVATQSKVRAPLPVKAIATAVGALSLLALVAVLLIRYFNAEEPRPIAPAPVAARAYSEADVQSIADQFALRLDQLNIPFMKLVPAAQQLTIQGALARDAESRFEHAVQELRDNNRGLKVRLDLNALAVSVLPFEITAAVGGANGSVLLADGQQLFVGAEEAGFKFLGLVCN
jgi:hypothetical protein